MTILRALSVIACVGLLVGCAASIPATELIDAGEAYQHASASHTGELMPADLSNTREARADSAAGKAVTTVAMSDSQATLDATKIRELIAGARRRAAAIP